MLNTFGTHEVILEAYNSRYLQILLSEPSSHILFSNVNMPGVDSAEITRWIKLKYPAIQTVALSVNSTEQALIEMILSVCCAYLLKDNHRDA